MISLNIKPNKKIKSSLYSRYSFKRTMSGGIHLRGFAPRLHCSEKTSQRWRIVGDTVSDMTGPWIELQTFPPIATRVTTELYSEEKNIVCSWY